MSLSRPRFLDPLPWGLLPLGLFCLAVSVVLSPIPAAAQSPWRSPHLADHDLVGRIWDVEAEAFIDAAAALDRISRARFVALGERHDNPDHHTLQARILSGMVARGRRPAVAWEMIDADQAEALHAYLGSTPTDASGLGRAVAWEKTGWPAWSLYQPIADAALGARLPMLTANLGRDMVKAISRQGYRALDDDRRLRLGLDEPLSEAVTAGQEHAVIDGHCGLLPASAAASMVRVQAARDATMAQALLDGQAHKGADGAVLIAGNGHVRKDIGAPWHLRRLNAAPDMVTVGILEVDAESTDPRDYGTSFLTGTPPFDILWFTPVWSLDDPCEGLAEHFGKAKNNTMKAFPPETTE